MIVLDGSEGEGGGQILRSALALSMASGNPFRIGRIRAGRKKPGLLRQHLTAVRAAARVCTAQVEGAEMGSQGLVFRPGPMLPGEYKFAVGTAGSSTLVFQTLMPALIMTGKPFALGLEGGTHNPAAPCLDFLDRVYLAALKRIGVTAEITVERRGFFPLGGGKWRVEVTPPASFSPLHIGERGSLKAMTVRIIWSKIPPQVAERAQSHLLAKLGLESHRVTVAEDAGSPGPGHVILGELQYDNVSEIITGFGAFGASPEALADGVIADMRRYESRLAPVGSHLADQLLLPMALGAGGSFRTSALTAHCRTNIGTIGRFLNRPIVVRELAKDDFEIGIA